METSKLFFNLPKHLIAQFPHERREKSRLVSVCPQSVAFEKIESLIHRIPRGAYLVLNTSRVRHARIFAQAATTNKRVEFLLLTKIGRTQWSVLSRGAASQKDYILDGGIRVRYDHPHIYAEEELTEAYIEQYGAIPLPPYIRRDADKADRSRYQTIYADVIGSAAAPTAGLHITEAFLAQCAMKRITAVPVILHTGLGTFAPIKKSNIEDHDMHTEQYEISPSSAVLLNEAKKQKKTIIAVGTTSLRTIESATDTDGKVQPGTQTTQLFITPGYCCKTATALLTNFHTPYSTLLVLVSALIGHDRALSIYTAAVRRGIRFFSYGDAMYINQFLDHSNTT